MIAATGGTFGATNYSIVYSNGTLTVVPAGTAITVTSPLNPAGYKTSLSFTATNLPTDATGFVLFLTNGTAFSSNSLAGGYATSLAITNLPRGTNLITAQYPGDTNYLGSTNNLALGQIVTNHPPVAGNVTLTRSLSSTKFSVSNLGTNVSDVDGDVVTFSISSPSTSTNGIVVTNNASLMFYFNTNTVNDQFSYTVRDSFGGTNSGLITMNFLPFKTGQTGTLAVTTNSVYLAYNAIPNFRYAIERSTNLTTWTAISTNTANSTNGTFQYTDTFSDLGTNIPASAYYRLHWNP